MINQDRERAFYFTLMHGIAQVSTKTKKSDEHLAVLIQGGDGE